MTILSPRSTLGTTAFILPSDLNDDWTYMAGSGHYRTADLKAALGIDELGCGCDEADDNLKAAIKRAEDAEAFGAAAVTRAEDAEGDAREWKARAEKAEAAIQRVRDVRNEWSKTLGRSGHVVEIDDALADKPAFTLPTEAGAGIRCTGPTASGLSYFTEMRLFSDGRWRDTEGCAWDAETVLDTFWDHRLLGADQ